MSLILKTDTLAGALLAEMRQALEAMEAGDYDLAYQLLEDRTRPKDPLTTLPNACVRLDILAVTRRMAALASPSLITESYASLLEVAAGCIADAFRSPEWLSRPENALTAARLAAEFGLSLEWDFEVTEES